MDKYFTAYERRIYSLGDLLGQAGGLYGACLLIGGIVINGVVDKLMMSSILRKIYQIDERRDGKVKDEMDKAKKGNLKKKTFHPLMRRN